ncbi:di-trans,poly-cis-decaprenylcistransferase [Actinomyces sp. zg-332]|uniref:polyprenyl diphosphate synthase n=1 Tax=Actinomyces sp. zg-332 TaxID=2708340 RepID=UPI0014242997|nr:polyprenyl diphosphate synthase [Actinomyces sp. zg-332]QPK94524.1 di-trans,poly-cis-decaprenylcistransferase [Actinomyces sp. zg-332]
METTFLQEYEHAPSFDTSKSPKHIAIIMDGNGRWANERNLPRTQGHIAGEEALMKVIAGAIQANVKFLSVYAFSTENWKRSPSEVKFLMGYSREVLRKRCDQLHAWGVKVLWSGRKPKLWKSVINELERAEKITENNTGLTLQMCINYGGQLEILDAVNAIITDKENGKIKGKITEKTFEKYLYNPQIPPVDLLIRTSGEKRLSNFLLWECAYAEFEFLDVYWPDMNQEYLYKTIENYTNRDRRFGGAIDKVTS